MNAIILFKIGPITIEFSTIISFILGIFIGLLLAILIYVLVVVSSLRTKDFFVKTKNDDLTTEEIKTMVISTRKMYKDKELRGELSRTTYCYQLSKDLAYGIAVRFYPKSKYPLFELSVNELTLLTGYITDRVNGLLDHRGIRLLRKLKVSTIVDLSTKKKEIEESKAFQTTMVIGKTLNKAKYILNVINPINWGRKLVVDKAINIIVDQICLVILSIVGEETYKIYSKKVFNKEVEIDTGSDEFIENMSDIIKDAAKEIDSSINSKPVSGQSFKKHIWIGQKNKPVIYHTFDENGKKKSRFQKVEQGVITNEEESE